MWVSTPRICFHSLCVSPIRVSLSVCLYSIYVPSSYKFYISFPYVPTSHLCLHSICPFSVCVPILCLSLLHLYFFYMYPHFICVPSPYKSYICFPYVSPLNIWLFFVEVLYPFSMYVPTSCVYLYSIYPFSVCVPILCLSPFHGCFFSIYILFLCVSPLYVCPFSV